MGDFFYNFGYYLIIGLPLILIFFCVVRIQKNRDYIKKMQNKKNDTEFEEKK